MISYLIGDIAEQDLILTLNENETVLEPVYVFQFIHVATKEQIDLIKYTTDDKSFWPERYNLFKINPGQLFTQPGEWHYKVTEQQTGVILEQGMLIMEKPIAFNFTKYHAATKFRTYKG